MPTERDSTYNACDSGPVSFDDKVSFLCDPGNYSEHPQRVTLRQTHHAWVFMTQRHVFKMKKPFRQGGYDYSSLESRYWLCKEEFRLNRRLAKNTYLDVVPLVLNDGGGLELEGDGYAIEWLVKMVRLPDSQMLLNAASKDYVPSAEIQKLMRKLLRFYSDAATVDFCAGGYVTYLRQKLELWSKELRCPQFALPDVRINELRKLQTSYIDANSELLEKRAKDGHIRDGHGDLRPGHVFLIENDEPEIIDCLEFDANLRRLDSAEELAFLAMECRHAGAKRLARECFDCYQTEFGATAVPRHLWNFYAALGATVRAGLSAWRMLDSAGGERWQDKAIRYLNDALHYTTLTNGGR